MEFIHFLRKESEEFGPRLMLLAMGGGLLNGIAIFILIQSAGSTRSHASQGSLTNLALFGVCFLGFYFCRRQATDKTNEIVEEVVRSIRLRIAEKALRTNLKGFERIGKSRFYTAVTTHIQSVSAAASVLIGASTSFVLVALGIGYIWWLSMTAFVISLCTVGLALVYYVAVHREVVKEYLAAAKIENAYFASYNDFLNGFADLKLNRSKGVEFFRETMVRQANVLQRARLETAAKVTTSSMISQTAFLVWLAATIYLLPVLDPEQVDRVVGISSVVLFIIGPITQLVGLAPNLAQAGAAVGEIQSLEADLERHVSEEPLNGQPVESLVLDEIRCEGLTYSYFDERTQRPFTLGPLDFSLKRGETVFIRGGNGSGKSTFLKVLSCLYPLDSGEILWNGKPVTGFRVQRYRDLFAAVFTDTQVFERLYGISDPDPSRVAALLSQMNLDDKTKIINRDITNRSLSTGQRKRLALVAARLESRHVYLLDEWAAEQDPASRQMFYEEILPELKREGKTVVVVTHDDRYFHCCDRVLTMDFGQFVES